METRVPAGEVAPGPASPQDRPDDALERRLASIEARLDTLDGVVREAVAQELQGMGDELRRAVSDLGRLLLRDLDRLTKVLAEHRDAIVERVHAAVAPPALSVPSVPSAPAPEATASAGAPEDAPADAGAPPGSSAPTPLAGEEGRWWAFPGRRRPRRSPDAR
jgi:hypothetical protein